MSAIPLRQDVHYPESDGKPIGETEIHIREIIYLFEALDEHLRGSAGGRRIGLRLLLDDVRGNPQKSVVPDVFGIRGVPRGERRIYSLGRRPPPSLTIEVTSDSTRNEDIVRKKALYESSAWRRTP